MTFPCTDGSTKLAGKDHEVRTSDQSRGTFRTWRRTPWCTSRRSGQSTPAEQQQAQGDLEARFDFWSMFGEILVTIITFNKELNSMRFPTLLKKLISSSGPIRHWMFCKRVRLMTSGASMVTASYLGRGVSRSSEE